VDALASCGKATPRGSVRPTVPRAPRQPEKRPLVSRPSGELLRLLLVAIFWIAQVQGKVRAGGHLGAAGVSDRATVPHGVLCLECAAVS